MKSLSKCVLILLFLTIVLKSEIFGKASDADFSTLISTTDGIYSIVQPQKETTPNKFDAIDNKDHMKSSLMQTKLTAAGATTIKTDYTFFTTVPSGITISSIDLHLESSRRSPFSATYVKIMGIVSFDETKSATITFYSPCLERLATPGKWTPTVNAVMKFTSPDGHSFWTVMFNTSGTNRGLDFLPFIPPSLNHSHWVNPLLISLKHPQVVTVSALQRFQVLRHKHFVMHFKNCMQEILII